MVSSRDDGTAETSLPSSFERTSAASTGEYCAGPARSTMRVPGRGSNSSSAAVRPTSRADTISPLASSGLWADGSTPASCAVGSTAAQFSMK